MHPELTSAFVSLLFLPACGGSRADQTGPPAETGADTAETGADTGDSAGDTGDTHTDLPPIEIPADNVANTLADCLGQYVTPEEYPNQLVQGDELQRYTLSNPEAVCGDGTRAVMYVRGATSAALADVWSIHLQGGGACSSYLSCALRWCGAGEYDSSKMSSQNLPLNVAGYGIYDAEAPNLLAGANQVFFYYCSSDAWRGQGSAAYTPDDLELPEDPGIEVPEGLPSYTVFRRGHTILSAGLDELAEGLVADGGEALPALSEASTVVFSGTSAGSVGAKANADYVRERLAPNDTEVIAVFDAANFPLSAHFDEPYSTLLDDYKAKGWAQSQATDDTPPFMDETCWNNLGGTDNEELCFDTDYVMMNYINTPFFVRQDLSDIGGGPEALGVPEDDYELAVLRMFESLADVPGAPGLYGPNCAQHVALEATPWWAVNTVTDATEVGWTFQQAVFSWYEGESVALIDEATTGGDVPGPASSCVD